MSEETGGEDTGSEDTGDYGPNEDGRGVSVLNPIKVVITNNGWYALKQKIFWVRKEGGQWEKFRDEGNGDRTFDCPREYVDFGFAFDILGGYNWPYSDPIWLKRWGPNDIVEAIYITTGGAAMLFHATIKVEVKGRKNGTGDTVNLKYIYNGLLSSTTKNGNEFSWE